MASDPSAPDGGAWPRAVTQRDSGTLWRTRFGSACMQALSTTRPVTDTSRGLAPGRGAKHHAPKSRAPAG